jgi:N-ethylmaleimide reductase
MASLFDPSMVGSIEVKNRCALAPMTRERCLTDGVPTEMHAAYFAQRAGAGLIVTGNNRISAAGAGSPHGSGMHSEAQVAGWRRTTDAVHAAGGKIFAQLFHSGGAGHPDTVPGAEYPVAPSAIAWGGPVRTVDGKVPCLVPRELDRAGIQRIMGDFARSAELALKAGFDGIEVHAASGYLFDQFFSKNTNRRTDSYGGSTANRCRALFEAIEAVIGVAGADRVGVKVSPEFNKYGVVVDDTPQETYSFIARTLSDFGVAYMHVADNSLNFDYHALLKPIFRGTYMAGVGFMPERAKAYVAEGKADMISFGRLFISNPDLPARIRVGAKLNPLDPATVYEASARGLLDYPTMEIAES